MTNECQSSSSAAKCTEFVAILLLRVFAGIPWIWGNLYVYVNSFYCSRGDSPSATSLDWLLSVEMIGLNVGLLIGHTVTRMAGIHATLPLSILGFNASILLSYFTVQHSAIALSLSFGALAGLFSGLILEMQLDLITKWTDHYRGLATNSVQAVVILAPVVINWLLTSIINPNNEKPDGTFENMAIFTQTDIAERVPTAFLIYGCLSTTANILGFLRIRETPERGLLVVESIGKLRKMFTSSYRFLLMQNAMTPVDRISTPNNDSSETVDDSSRPGVTPWKAFKNKEFYMLVIFSIVMCYLFSIVITYYKTFGLLRIPDDRFFILVATVKSLCTPVSMWVAGACTDRFGVKTIVILISSVMSINSSFFYLTVFNKWVYLFSCIFYDCTLSSLMCLLPICCLQLFGKSHFTIILGMVFTASSLVIPAIPPLTEWIISSHGWFILYTTASVLSVFNLIYLTWMFPNGY